MEDAARAPYRAGTASIVAMRVYAHQGGWDEILMVLAPLLVFAILLAVARRRAEELDTPEHRTADETSEDRERVDPT